MTLPRRPDIADQIPNYPFYSPRVYQIRGPYWNMTIDGGLSVDAQGSVQTEGSTPEPPTSYLYSPNGLVGVGAGLEVNSDGEFQLS